MSLTVSVIWFLVINIGIKKVTARFKLIRAKTIENIYVSVAGAELQIAHRTPKTKHMFETKVANIISIPHIVKLPYTNFLKNFFIVVI
jgi:hypothetical protein